MDYTKLISDDVFCFKLINNDIVIGKVIDIAEPSVLLISRPLELIFVENNDEESIGFSGFGRLPTSFYLVPYLFPAISAKTIIPMNIAHVITFNKVTPMLREAYLETLEKIDNSSDIDDNFLEKEDDDQNDNDDNPNTRKKRYLH